MREVSGVRRRSVKQAAALVAALGVAAVASVAGASSDGQALHAPDTVLSSRRDTSDPRVRDLPIRCREGDLERFPGRTLGAVFGDAWPGTDATPGARSLPARLHQPAQLEWPRGLGREESILVTATLVDAAGTPLQTEVICATTQGLDAHVERAALRSRFAPATVDGIPTIGVAMHVWRFRISEQEPPRRRAR